MNLALDYDETYDRDKIFWDFVIDLAQSRGHRVYCITARSERHKDEVLDDLEKKLGRDAILFTAGAAKKSYAYSKGIDISVWIDDRLQQVLRSKEVVYGIRSICVCSRQSWRLQRVLGFS